MSDIEKVKKLRESTGAGFKDCNLAIKESGGDIDKAIEILRVKGISKASKKMSRDAKEGVRKQFVKQLLLMQDLPSKKLSHHVCKVCLQKNSRKKN
jgi:translation elongation factor EF-Ts